jgi:hypothetical protein
MKTLGMTSFGLAVFLLAGSLLVGAEPSRRTPQAQTEPKGAQQVEVKVDEVVSVAVGDKATATLSLGHRPAPPSGEPKGTVRVGTISRHAVGPNAAVCIQIPFVTDAPVCDEAHPDGPDSEQ